MNVTVSSPPSTDVDHQLHLPMKQQVSMDTLESTILMESSDSSLSSWSSDGEDEHQPLHIELAMIEDSSSSSSDSIDSHYEILPHIIGEGQFGIVRECIQKSTGNKYAIKSIRKHSDEDQSILQREVELLDYAGHHHGIVNLIDVFESTTEFHIITELCLGGELYDRIIEQMNDAENSTSPTLFKEESAAQILYQILDSVAYLHDRDIVHRDLKPENFLLSGDNQIKLIDFGLATTHDEQYDAPLSSVVGTPFYMAPEVLKKSYTKACDVWSIGVIAYVLLCGRPPFEGEADEEVFANIKRGQFDLNVVAMSDEANDFIKCLMKRDPRRRWTAEDALQHPWMTKNLNKGKK